MNFRYSFDVEVEVHMPYLQLIAIGTCCLEDWCIYLRDQSFEMRVGTVFDLTGINEVHIGRDCDNDLVSPVLNVSRHHFRLYRRENRYVYEDIGSRQTPILNGECIPFGTIRVLADCDTFNAAGVMFRYYELQL